MEDITQPVLISQLPMEKHSSDSGAEIFISVSTSHALIASYISDGKTEVEIRAKAGIK